MGRWTWIFQVGPESSQKFLWEKGEAEESESEMWKHHTAGSVDGGRGH